MQVRRQRTDYFVCISSWRKDVGPWLTSLTATLKKELLQQFHSDNFSRNFSSVMGVNCFSHPIFYGANCSSHHVLSFLMVLTIRASVIFLSSGVINVWGTAVLFISLQVQNNYKVLLINYSILKLHLQIFSEAVSSYFTLRLHPPILFWGFVFIIYFEALSSQVILKLCPWILT